MITKNSTVSYLESVNIGDVKRLADRLGIPLTDLLEASRDLSREAASREQLVGRTWGIEHPGAIAYMVEQVPAFGSGYLIETSYADGREPKLEVTKQKLAHFDVGRSWDSNQGVKPSKQTQPAEFTFRCVAKVRWIASTAFDTRWIEATD